MTLRSAVHLNVSASYGYGVWCMVYGGCVVGVWSMVYGRWSTVYGRWSSRVNSGTGTVVALQAFTQTLPC